MIRRGDIYYIKPAARSTPNGVDELTARPAIVVSNNKNNLYSDYIEIVFLTTRYKRKLPTHVEIASAPRPSTALCENIQTINVERLSNYVAKATAKEMREIDAALAISVGLDIYAAAGGLQCLKSAT